MLLAMGFTGRCKVQKRVLTSQGLYSNVYLTARQKPLRESPLLPVKRRFWQLCS